MKLRNNKVVGEGTSTQRRNGRNNGSAHERRMRQRRIQQVTQSQTRDSDDNTGNRSRQEPIPSSSRETQDVGQSTERFKEYFSFNGWWERCTLAACDARKNLKRLFKGARGKHSIKGRVRIERLPEVTFRTPSERPSTSNSREQNERNYTDSEEPSTSYSRDQDERNSTDSEEPSLSNRRDQAERNSTDSEEPSTSTSFVRRNAPDFIDDVEKENFIRVYWAVTQSCQGMYRNALEFLIPHTELSERVQSVHERFRRSISTDEWNSIQRTEEEGYEGLELNLIYKIFRNVCDGLIPLPARSWGTWPCPHNKSFGDDLERIRYVWNEWDTVAESPRSGEGFLPDRTYTKIWVELEGIASRMINHLEQNPYRHALNALRTTTIPETAWSDAKNGTELRVKA